MVKKPLNPIGSQNFYGGYVADRRNRAANELAPPSANVRITRSGAARTRDGYEATSWDLNQAGKAAFPFHVARFNITFFAVGVKLLYVDHNDSDAVRDTGVTMTDGTTSRMEEFAGQLLVTNKTDGQRMVLITRLSGAVSMGAATIVTATDGAQRADRFDTALSPATKNLRIRGTNEEYASISGGTFTLSGTASQAYPDGTVAVVVYDTSSSAPKASKILAWRESINAVGLSDSGAGSANDVPPAVHAFTKFATAATIESIVAWSGGTAGTELVGKSGELVNIAATDSNLWLFKTEEMYITPISSLNGSSGARPPTFFAKHGCANEDCAVNVGSDLVFVTRGRRILKIRYADQGATKDNLDESFDDDIRPLLQLLDDGYSSDCILWHDPGENVLYFQGSFGGQVLTLPYDCNPVYDKAGAIVSMGRWLPPDTNKSFKMYFNIGSDLYATDRTDDTIYKVNEGVSDDGSDIECVIAMGEQQVQDGRVTCRWKECEVSGGMANGTTVTFQPIVSGTDGTAHDFTLEGGPLDTNEIGSVAVGEMVVSGSGSGADMGEFDKRLAIHPTLGQSCQPIFSCFGDGHAFRIDSWKLKAVAYGKSVLTLS